MLSTFLGHYLFVYFAVSRVTFSEPRFHGLNIAVVGNVKWLVTGFVVYQLMLYVLQ